MDAAQGFEPGRTDRAPALDSAGPDAPLDSAMPDGAVPDSAAPDTGSPDTALPDRPPDLPPDAASAARSVAIAATGGISTQLGTTSGGTRFQDECGAGEALVGYHGYSEPSTNMSSDYVVGMQSICAQVRVPPGTVDVETASPVVRTLRGPMGPVVWQAVCPANMVIFGTWATAASNMVENFRFRCASLVASASPPGAVAAVSVRELSWTSRRGLPETGSNCPVGQIARGHILHVGSWIDGYQLLCGTPTVAVP
jgi:hypothetical protein